MTAVGVATAVLLAASMSPAWAQPAPGRPIPPPPPNPGDTRPPSTSPRAPSAPKGASCPRCGYVCDRSWNFCIACGWDRTRLIGEAEEQRLQSIARASLRLTVGGRPNRHGTAFPYGHEGYMVTNARLLVGAAVDTVRMMTWDNHELEAAIVGIDLPTGLGLLKVDRAGVPGIELAPLAPMPPGATWAVCYPIVHEGDIVRLLPVSLHRGRLTAAAQSGTHFVSYEDLLRTDHAIEEGCSGGPLVDAAGRIAGMILGSPDDGLTYALPLDRLRPVLDALVRKEAPKWPYFGLGLVAADERRRKKFDLGSEAAHPVIGYLIAESPAARAGARPGDMLVAIGGQPVASVWDAGSRLLTAAPGGAAVSLTLRRDGSDREVAVTPGERPVRVLLDPTVEIEETLEANLVPSPAQGGKTKGLIVSDLVRGGRGEKSLFQNGDVIVGVESKAIDTPEELNQAVRLLFKEIFSDQPRKERRFASSYIMDLEVRPEGKPKVNRRYLNLFPDVLAPPVY